MTMNIQPEPNSEKKPKNSVNENHSEINQKQLHDFQQEIERIYLDTYQLRKLLQTLVTGLFIAVFLALGISIWFAYRLLLQEKISQQQLAEAETTKAELISQVEELKQQIQLQDQQLKRIRQQVPENLTTLIEENQSKIDDFRARIQQLEGKKSNHKTR